jgi:hypothetical protein
MRTIAEELLIKHRDAPLQLETLASIASQRGWPLDAAIPALDSTDTAWLRAIEAAYQPDDDAEFPALPRHDGHAEAMRDLERVLRHQLPWALYLRNFDHANKVHSLGEPIAYHSDNSSHYIVPEITYSLVDHKIVQLFSEGVITVSDPHTNFWHRSTLIPMLSLRHEKWQEVVAGLMRRCARVVMLLDELTPGVETELNLLREVDAAERTLIVCGHAFRVGQLTLPEKVASDFPHVVDWIDFSYDEAHYDMRYKAHRIVQPYLQRYVRGNAGPVVRNWLQT